MEGQRQTDVYYNTCMRKKNEKILVTYFYELFHTYISCEY